MVRHMFVLACLFGSFALLAPAASPAVEVGDAVLAYWAESGAYFLGTAVEKRGDAFYVVFEDGDRGEVPAAKVRANDLKVGSAVVARWDDGEYYSGKVAKIVGRAYYIHYDDGDRGWAPAAWIAVK